MCINRYKNNPGFTLIEILIALFIFSIISLMLAGSLRTVISAYQRTEQKTTQFDELRMALLVFSREITQAVSRPIFNAAGSEEAALLGDHHSISFTYTGVASSGFRSSLARVQYFYAGNGFWRRTYPVLDQAPQTQPLDRLLLSPIAEVRFEYLDQAGRLHDEWQGDAQNPLPRAVGITFVLKNNESLSQFYLIPASSINEDSSDTDSSKPEKDSDT